MSFPIGFPLMFMRALTLACLTWAGCSDHTSAIVPDECTSDCDLGGGNGDNEKDEDLRVVSRQTVWREPGA